MFQREFSVHFLYQWLLKRRGGVGGSIHWILWMWAGNIMFLEKTYTMLWFYMEKVSHCFHHHRKQLNKNSSDETSLRRYVDIRHECEKRRWHKWTSEAWLRSVDYTREQVKWAWGPSCAAPHHVPESLWTSRTHVCITRWTTVYFSVIRPITENKEKMF